MKIPPLGHDAGGEAELVGERRLVAEQGDEPVAGARMAVRMRPDASRRRRAASASTQP
jgi:hypothetical protein